MTTPSSGRFTLGALGDSISIAYNASAAGPNTSLSWATGELGGDSHRERLRRVLPSSLDIHAVNVAANGALAADLAGQIDRLLLAQPDYVTLLIGANDLARWLIGEYGVLLALYVEDVRRAVQRLVAANPRIMILLVAVPDQSRVVQLLTGMPGAASLAALARSPQLAHLVAGYRERAARLNRALEEVARDHSGHVRFARGVAAARFSDDHLSPLDSYHPSAAGQRLLAELTWNEGFFP